MIRSPTSQWLLLITHHIAAIVRLYRCITMGGATRGEVWQYNVHPLLEPAAYMGDMFVSFQSGDINWQLLVISSRLSQHYSENVYDELLSAVSALKCSKAVTCFSTHWNKEPSVLDVPRSNIVAEQAVKVMEELHATCKTDK